MSALKLNQVIALEKTAKAQTDSAVNQAYHTLQKPQLFNGQERVYTPRDDEGERFPAEIVRVQQRVREVWDAMVAEMSRRWDLTCTKDAANQLAVADIMVGDRVLVQKVPVTTLLLLEKQLVDLLTFVSKAPVLDATEAWGFNADTQLHETKPAVTFKTVKTPVPFVKAEATEKHAAQVEVVHKDVTVGQWATTKLSGALSQGAQRVLIGKLQLLQQAVKRAREEANMTVAPDMRIAEAIFDFLTYDD